MDIDAVFNSVADNLINKTFNTPVLYIRSKGATYDPATGNVTEDIEQYNVNAGIEQIELTEEGGTAKSSSDQAVD